MKQDLNNAIKDMNDYILELENLNMTIDKLIDKQLNNKN